MERSLVELESIIRDKICKVAQAIQSVKSDDIQQYLDAIRRNVCAVCADQASDQSCETRLQVQCALDAYLLLVVDAIEEATGKTFDLQGIGAAGASSGAIPGVPGGSAVQIRS